MPALNVLDFGCFLSKFTAGCSSWVKRHLRPHSVVQNGWGTTAYDEIEGKVYGGWLAHTGLNW